MKVGDFSLGELGDDSEAHEKAWNDWVSFLATQGWRPEGEPIDTGDDTIARFELLPIPADERVEDEKAAVA